MQTLHTVLVQPNTIWHDPLANQELIAKHLNQLHLQEHFLHLHNQTRSFVV